MRHKGRVGRQTYGVTLAKNYFGEIIPSSGRAVVEAFAELCDSSLYSRWPIASSILYLGLGREIDAYHVQRILEIIGLKDHILFIVFNRPALGSRKEG